MIRGATVMALDGRRTLRNTDVLIQDGRIAAIGGVESAGSLITEVRGVLVPALVQAHLHSDLALTDQYFVPEANPWLLSRRQIPAWQRASDAEDRRVQALAAFSRGVHAGASTFADVIRAEASVEAAATLGVRFVACADVERGEPAAIVDEVSTWIEAHSLGHLASLSVFSGDIESCSLRRLRRCATLAAERRIPLIAHAGLLPPGSSLSLRRLAQIAEFGAQLVVCHGRGRSLSSGDAARFLAETHASVVLTPTADVLWHGKGPPLEMLLDAGVNLAVGSDNGATRTQFDLFRELRILKRGLALHCDHPASRALEIGSVGGARALQLETGAISVGRRADLLLLDVEPLPGEDHEALAERVLELAHPEKIRGVWIDGEVAILDGRFAHVDPPSEATEEIVRGRLLHAVSSHMKRVSWMERAVLDWRLLQGQKRA